tara:strand:+ start:1294 stop:1575 length:282 start_codon:yes stop_codon:yes gene_type:complete
MVPIEKASSRESRNESRLFKRDKKKSGKLIHPNDITSISLEEKDTSYSPTIRCHYNVSYLKKKWSPKVKIFGRIYDKSVDGGKLKSILIIESR